MIIDIKFNDEFIDILKRIDESDEHVDYERVKELGYTSDIMETGYITPDDRWIDLSGKNEGGTPGVRSLDHREVGGVAGMIEFINKGNIRIDAKSGSIDIGKKPTQQQLNTLVKIIRMHNGNVRLDMWNKLGEYENRGYYGTYTKDFNTLNNEYEIGTNPAYIINDVKKFFNL